MKATSTDTKFIGNVNESLNDIVKIAQDYHFSLSLDIINKLLDTLPQESFQSILNDLEKNAPDDLKTYCRKLSKIYSPDVLISKEIVKELALRGDIPKEYKTKELLELEHKEISTRDPKVIQTLKKFELQIELEDLRHIVQKLIIRNLPKEIKSKYNLTFDDLSIDEAERSLIKQQLKAESTESLFDDYLVEFQLAINRQYEPEEIIFLVKKLIYYSKKENKPLPNELLISINLLLNKEKEAFKYLGYPLTLESKDDFSFHRVKLNGGNYNFAYFSGAQSNSEFNEYPQLNDRPVLLLLHGIKQSWANWRFIIGAFKDKYQIIVPDMNGFGDSDELVLFHNLSNFVDYIGDFLKELKVKKYDVIGHSFGGFTTQKLLDSSILQPDHAIIVSSGTHLTLSFINKFIGNIIQVGPIKRLYFNVLFKYLERKSIETYDETTDIFTHEERLRRIDKSSTRTLSELLSFLIHKYNISGQKIKTHAKCLIVYGEKDDTVTPEVTKELAEVFEGAKILSIPGDDHTQVIRSMGIKYKDKISEFLNS